MCPFPLGRLESLYQFLWNGVDSNGRSGSITNGTAGVYWLAEERNSILHVNISGSPLQGFECVVTVQLCRPSSACGELPTTTSNRSRINLTSVGERYILVIAMN